MAKSRVSRVAADLREEKQLVKQEIAMNRKLIVDIKEKHTEIMAMEEKLNFSGFLIKK